MAKLGVATVPRLKRNPTLESRSARAKLKTRHAPYWQTIHKGMAIGYRKGTRGGVWMARYLIDGEHRKRTLGTADDHQEADGIDVLTYAQAHKKALEQAVAARQEDAEPSGPYTVAEAMTDYLEYLKAHGKSYADTKRAVDAHIIAKLGKKQVSELTKTQISRWHHTLATAPARLRGPKKVRIIDPSDADAMRKRKATANRILTNLKAALNKAVADRDDLSDKAWRHVKPFRGVDVPRVRYLTPDECTRLINACPADLRTLIRGALMTGCRYGELIRMRAHDFNPDAGTVLVAESKSKVRHVPLTNEGQQFFARLTAGRVGQTFMFTKADGEPWGKGHQTRPMREACAGAEINPPVGFHILRHTYGSLLAMKGVSLQVIAEAMGHTSTRMTERHYAHMLPSYVAETIRANLPSFGLERDNVRSIR